jgi:diguanylate cyclase (GGDEF)-like protein
LVRKGKHVSVPTYATSTGAALTGAQDAGAGLRPPPEYADTPALLLRVHHLQAELAGEIRRRLELERSVAHARAELEATRAELAGTRAGTQRALHEALHDALTSLPNRRCFRERLDEQLRRNRSTSDAPLAVMYIDLDAFKPINDGHGHDVGDEVLKIIAARLAHAVRAEDLMSRLGGDEFACLLANGAPREQLRELAAKLIEIVASPVTAGGHCFRVRPSVGVAMAPGDGQSADALIRSADTAMFHAKRQRTGVTFFDELGPASHPAGAQARRSRGTASRGGIVSAG